MDSDGVSIFNDEQPIELIIIFTNESRKSDFIFFTIQFKIKLLAYFNIEERVLTPASLKLPKSK
jgi:hypothetical protein